MHSVLRTTAIPTAHLSWYGVLECSIIFPPGFNWPILPWIVQIPMKFSKVASIIGDIILNINY